MLSSLLLATGAFVAYVVFKFVTGLQRNIALAKSTGLPYYVVRESAMVHSFRGQEFTIF